MKRTKPIALCDTKDYSREEWEKGLRQHGPFYKEPLNSKYIPICIGGSDVSTIFGDNPWKSRLELFHEKSGHTAPKYARKMPQDLLDAGHILEEFVAKNFRAYMEKNCGVSPDVIEIINDTHMYQHPQYPFAIVNLDRLIKVNGIPGILEIKTTGNFKDIALWKKGIVPKKYEWQCRYYMAVMDLDYCYIACMWGYSTDEMAVIKIERDLDIEKTMLEEVCDFAYCCEMGIIPDESTDNIKVLAKYYARMYGVIKDPSSTLDLPLNEETREAADLAITYQARKSQIEKLEEELGKMEDRIVKTILKYTKGQGSYCNLRIDEKTVLGMAIKASYFKDSFDEERFKADYPDEYAEFLEEKTTKELNQTALKKKYKGKIDLPSYVIHGEFNPDKPVTISKIELKDIPAESEVIL